MMMVSKALHKGLVIFRTFVLWNKEKRILQLLIAGSIVVSVTSCIFIGMAVRFFTRKQLYNIMSAYPHCLVCPTRKPSIYIRHPRMWDTYCAKIFHWCLDAAGNQEHSEPLSELFTKRYSSDRFRCICPWSSFMECHGPASSP